MIHSNNLYGRATADSGTDPERTRPNTTGALHLGAALTAIISLAGCSDEPQSSANFISADGVYSLAEGRVDSAP